jgi:hypothetical protein
MSYKSSKATSYSGTLRIRIFVTGHFLTGIGNESARAACGEHCGGWIINRGNFWSLGYIGA